MERNKEEERARKFVEAGDKALNRFSWFGLTQSAKFDDAIDAYTKAANLYKVNESPAFAASVFVKLADLSVQASLAPFQVAQHYFAAGDCYQAANDSEKARDAYTSGIDLMVQEGRFGQAAKICEKLADILVQELSYEAAISAYDRASKFYLADNSPTRSSRLVEKRAKLQAEHLGDAGLAAAAVSFAEIGANCTESNLLKFNARKHFFHACTCLLARQDIVATELKHADFAVKDYTWTDSREGKLIQSVVESLKNEDIDAFSDALFAYDTVSRLDPWETSLFLKIKKQMDPEDEEEPDLC